jgi:copper chaperone
MTNVILNVPDLSCSHCEKTVRTALEGQPGVQSVYVDLPTKKVYLAYDESAIDLAHVSEILDEEGYTVADYEPGLPPARKRELIPLLGK